MKDLETNTHIGKAPLCFLRMTTMYIARKVRTQLKYILLALWNIDYIKHDFNFKTPPIAVIRHDLIPTDHKKMGVVRVWTINRFKCIFSTRNAVSQ